MSKYKKLQVLVIGIVLGLANISMCPTHYVRAEEREISKSAPQLKTMEVQEFKLNQVFSPDETMYTATVTNEIKNMTLLVTAMEKSTAIHVNGHAVSSGERINLPLESGENIFTITVSNESEVRTYTITVIRVEKTNNLLADLSLSAGAIKFNSNVTKYSIQVDNHIKQLTIKPKAAIDTSTIKINGKTVTAEGYVVALPIGKTEINIIVIAESGEKITYTLTVIRNDNDVEKTNQHSNSTEQPGATSSEQKTNANQKNPSSNGLINQVHSSSEQIPDATGKEGQRLDSNKLIAPVNNEMKSSGNNSGTNIKTTKANLQTLTVSSGNWNKAFASDVYTYHINIDNVSSVTISANKENRNATLVIDGVEVSSRSKVAISDHAQTVISVVVTYENDRKTYVFVFDKDIDEIETEDITANTLGATATSTETTAKEVITNEANISTTYQQNTNRESQTKPTSLWQRILSFFGM